MKTEFILDAIHLDEVRERLAGSAAFVFAYPATLYAVSTYRNSSSRHVREMAVKIAQDMARAEV